MTTFSQMVDSIAVETGRPDLKTTIAAYLNQTIRELHFAPPGMNLKVGAAVLYHENYLEDQLTADSDVGFYWDAPNPSTFQNLTLVQYQNVVDTDTIDGATIGIFPPLITPSRAMKNLTSYYYRGGSRFLFVGYGGLNALINISYYEFLKSLDYFDADARPATYTESGGWVYDDTFQDSGDAENQLILEAAARGYTSNWMLLRYSTILEEGLRAKIYKRLSDDKRASTCYSLYQQLRVGLYTTETNMQGGYQ